MSLRRDSSMRASILTLPLLLLIATAPAGAVDVNLTTVGSSGSIGNGTFVQMSQQPTGTGIIDPFLRVQQNGSEAGFNTDHSPLDGDLADVKAGSWTHSVVVDDLNPETYNNVLSAKFLLDINQTSANPRLSLDDLRIYTAATPDISDNATLFAQNLVYSMGAGNRVLLDFSLNPGSGAGDMYFYLPWSLFAGLEDQYLYLYCEFGASGGDYASNDGFEEWAHLLVIVSVDESTMSAVKALYK